MNLEDGLKYIYEKKFPIEYMINPFTLYSMLSDYCNKSFKDIEDVKLYIKVIERINLVEFVINKPLSTLEEMMLKNYENISYIDYEIYKRFVYATILMKYKPEDLKDKSKRKKEFIYETPKNKTLLYYSPNSNVYHHAYNCKKISNAKDVFLTSYFGDTQIPICTHCRGYEAKKNHKELTLLQGINTMIFGIKNDDIQLRKNGESISQKKIEESILKKRR